MTAHGGGSTIQTGNRIAIAHIVLGLCCYRIRVFQGIALQAPNRFPGKLSAQVNILTIRFLSTAITGVTNQIHYRAEGFPNTADISLCCDTASHFISQFRVKGCGESNLLREASGIFGHEPVQRLFTE